MFASHRETLQRARKSIREAKKHFVQRLQEGASYNDQDRQLLNLLFEQNFRLVLILETQTQLLEQSPAQEAYVELLGRLGGQFFSLDMLNGCPCLKKGSEVT